MHRTALLAVVLVTNACAPRFEVPAYADVPAADDVQAMTLYIARDSVVAVAPEQVAEFLAILHRSWSSAEAVFGTYPTPTKSVVLRTSAGTNRTVFLGPSWIGTLDGTAPLSPGDSMRVGALLRDLWAEPVHLDPDRQGHVRQLVVVLPRRAEAITTRFRFLTGGREHVATQLFVERLTPRGIDHSEEVPEFEGRFWSLGFPRLTVKTDGSAIIEFPGTHAYSLEDTSFEIAVQRDGGWELQQIEEAL